MINSKLPAKVLLIVLVFLISSCAAARTNFSQSLNSQKAFKDGVYMGEDKTHLCSVKLEVTVKEGKIADIKILEQRYTYPLAGRAYKTLPGRIVQEQSVDVDGVSAATVSSNNIKKAVSEALKKAQE